MNKDVWLSACTDNHSFVYDMYSWLRILVVLLSSMEWWVNSLKYFELNKMGLERRQNKTNTKTSLPPIQPAAEERQPCQKAQKTD